MYKTYFGLKENPFSLTPDPRFLFLSPSHGEALDHLLYGINERKGFIAITGGIGTGKTTLCRALLNQLDAGTKSALIFNSFVTDVELLKSVNREFGIEMGVSASVKKDYVEALNDFLLDNFGSGGNAVLLIDEAQNLSHSALEQIRMLSNLETEKEKLLQIVLMGQSELKTILAHPSLRQLDERIVVRYNIEPLDPEAIKQYVEHRLRVAGAGGNIRFTPGAFEKLYAQSNGNPRRINATCDRALLIAYVKETHTISKGILGEAVADLRKDRSGVPRARQMARRKAMFVTVPLVLLFIGAGFAGWNFRNHIVTPLSRPPENSVSKRIPVRPIPTRSRVAHADIFLDESSSLEVLFDLMSKGLGRRGFDVAQAPLGLVSFRLAPEHYAMLKGPFRVRLPDGPFSPSSSPRYFLIRQVTGDEAIAVDAGHSERLITKDFILTHWGAEVSWISPLIDKGIRLTLGMRGPRILRVQKILDRMGYLLNVTGMYDKATFHEVMRFQEDFGLRPDGEVGLRTITLLDQMAGADELHP